jgi:signal peptidase II
LSPRSARRLRRLSWWITALVLLTDQLSKAWAVRELPFDQVRPLLPGLLELRKVINTGAAFGLFTEATVGLGLISAIVSVAVAAGLVLRPPDRPWQAAGLGFLLGGALGNGIDRWRLGAVVDLLAFVPFDFPVFNLADVSINVAVACLLIDLLRQGAARPERPPADRHG